MPVGESVSGCEVCGLAGVNWTCAGRPNCPGLEDAPANVRVFQYKPHRFEGERGGETRLHPVEIAPEGAPPALAATMRERNARYGDFRTQAKFGEALRYVFEASPNWRKLSPSMRLALLWISDKLARILCGDWTYRDSWHDVAGYASLIERELAV